MPSPAPTAPQAPVRQVPLLDVCRENLQLEQEILAAITHVIHSGRFVLGPEVQQLEQRVAKLCDVSHAIGCASGSDALLLALMAIGVGPGDEVIIPSFTFFATASAITRLGATPVFVDIDADSFNIDPDLIEPAITKRTKAIIPVHLFGQPADMKSISEIGRKHNLVVIEDAAQAIGAAYDSQPVGSLGDIACFSFYPTKNLGGFGDAGMLTTNSREWADRLGLLRTHGMRPRYYHGEVGINSRLDTIQAVVLNIKLPHLASWSTARSQNAERYQRQLTDAGVSEYVVLPPTSPNVTHVWNQYTVRTRDRDDLRQFLMQYGVGSEIYYPVPLHQQECFKDIPLRHSLPETERAAQEVLSLPIFPMMTAAEQETVVMRVSEFVKTKQAQLPKRDVA